MSAQQLTGQGLAISKTRNRANAPNNSHPYVRWATGSVSEELTRLTTGQRLRRSRSRDDPPPPAPPASSADQIATQTAPLRPPMNRCGNAQAWQRQSAVKRLPTVPGAKGDSPEPSPLAINVASPSICARAASGASVCEMVMPDCCGVTAQAYPLPATTRPISVQPAGTIASGGSVNSNS